MSGTEMPLSVHGRQWICFSWYFIDSSERVGRWAPIGGGRIGVRIRSSEGRQIWTDTVLALRPPGICAPDEEILRPKKRAAKAALLGEERGLLERRAHGIAEERPATRRRRSLEDVQR